jgi:hypothetical protein
VGSSVENFEELVLEPLMRNEFFRIATDAEIDATFAAYQAARASRDISQLIRVWKGECEVTRGRLPLKNQIGFKRAHLLPAVSNGAAFLAISRSVIEAGKKLRARLRKEVFEALSRDFPWLEHRHEHIPQGWTPEFDFPDAIRLFLDGDVEAVKVRWQLMTAMNEVIQSAYSHHLAGLFGIRELHVQADREEELARHYFSHWMPEVSREEWRQILLVLDGMNAATLEMCCTTRLGELLAYSASAVLLQRAQWQSFLDGLGRPQQL